MKKLIAMILALIMVLSLAACGQDTTETTSPKRRSEKSSQSENQEETESPKLSKKEKALQCLRSIYDAESAQAIAQWVTEDTQNQAESMFADIKDKSWDLTATYKGHADGYDIFYIEVFIDGKQEIDHKGYCVMKPDGDRYLLCQAESILNQVFTPLACSGCGGSGSITHSQTTVCAACGGVGQHYIPNAYYDAGMNMWMGQYIACAGCGGIGHTTTSTSSTCAVCGGAGLNFG